MYSSSPALHDLWKGGIGLALFSLLDTDAFKPLAQQRTHDVVVEEEHKEEKLPPLVILPKPPCSIKSIGVGLAVYVAEANLFCLRRSNSLKE